MADVIYDCDDAIIDPSCDPCLTDLEQGRVRSVAFVHKDLYAAISANPGDANTWAQGIADKKIFVIPETQGSFDGGSPVEVTGYGDVATKIVGYEFSVAYKDPSLKANQGFYNTIKGSTKWHVAFRTETQTRFSSKPATIIPKAPVEDDLNSEAVWDVEVKWSEKNQPVIFDTPDDIFTCTPIDPTPVVPFTFRFGYGDAPTTESGVNAGTSGTANHNQKAVVPDFGNSTDDTLWYAEPVSEPAKTKWYNTSTNNGSIGAGNTFLSPVVVGTFRVYVSGFETSFDTPSAVEFRIS